ncbi:MAG: hypothetical protein HFE63_05910 [Clostridiales bacterium]|nr:hypothetical protein [Clostridiales bacterium]
MTATTRTWGQTMRVYIADFTKCNTKIGFFRVLILSFGLKMTLLASGSTNIWRGLCEQIAAVTSGFVPVRVRISGLENVYSFYPAGVDTLLRILRAAEEERPLLRTDVRIGDAIWDAGARNQTQT